MFKKTKNALVCMNVFYYIIITDMFRPFMWPSSGDKNTNTIIMCHCGVILTHYNCICILVLFTLRMATWLAEICRWLLCIKITLIHPSVLFYKFVWILAYHIISFVFIQWICTGLQNPCVYGNSQIYLRNLKVKSI